MILGLTHYVDEGGTMVHAFGIESCETCGGPVEKTNAVGLAKVDAVRFCLTKLDRRLPEQYFCEETGMCNCTNCA